MDIALLIVNLFRHRKDSIFVYSVFNELDKTITCCDIFSVYIKLVNQLAVRAATQYHTRAWQTLIYEKECFILLLKQRYYKMVHELKREKLSWRIT